MRAVETPIGVDRFIGKQQPTRLAAANQQFHGVQQEATGDLRISEFAGALKIIPGNLNSVLH
jgi:hypothetical protein